MEALDVFLVELEDSPDVLLLFEDGLLGGAVVMRLHWGRLDVHRARRQPDVGSTDRVVPQKQKRTGRKK